MWQKIPSSHPFVFGELFSVAKWTTLLYTSALYETIGIFVQNTNSDT